MRIVLEAWLGNLNEAAKQLDALVAASPQTGVTLYNAACAAAVASQACGESDAPRSKQFADRAIELLGSAIARGLDAAMPIHSDSDFAPLHGDPRFLTILEKLESPGRFAAVWHADVEFESKLIGPMSPESLLAQGHELETQGFRPVAIAVSGLAECVYYFLTIDLHSAARGLHGLASTVNSRRTEGAGGHPAGQCRGGVAAVAAARLGMAPASPST